MYVRAISSLEPGPWVIKAIRAGGIDMGFLTCNRLMVLKNKIK